MTHTRLLSSSTSGALSTHRQKQLAFTWRSLGSQRDLRKAIETEESLRWKLIAAQTRIEIWRTESVNNRNIERATL